MLCTHAIVGVSVEVSHWAFGRKLVMFVTGFLSSCVTTVDRAGNSPTPHSVMLSFLLAATTTLTEPQLALEWEAPPECPSAADVLHRLAPEATSDALTIAATVESDANGYRLHGVVIAGARRQPFTLSHPHSCPALVDKLALYVEPLLVALPAVPEEPPALATWTYLRAAADLDATSLHRCTAAGCTRPAVAAGALLALGLARGRLRLEFGVPVLTDVVPTDAADGAASTRWIVTGGQLRGCGVLTRRRVELSLCGELGGRVVIGRIHAADPRYTPRTPYLGWGLARLVLGAVWWVHPHVGLRAEVAPGVNLHPADHRIHYTDPFAVRHPILAVGFLHFGAGLGLDVRFGDVLRRAR